MTEARDWTASQFERCPDCGANAAAVADANLGAEILAAVAALGRILAAGDPVGVRQRPSAHRWSALEYAAHVRDLLPVMEGRVKDMVHGGVTTLGWWDHEAAIEALALKELVPVLVHESASENARSFAAVLATLEDDDWDIHASRRPGEDFTVRGLARFVLHEVIHHGEDAARSLRLLTSSPESD